MCRNAAQHGDRPSISRHEGALKFRTHTRAGQYWARASGSTFGCASPARFYLVQFSQSMLPLKDSWLFSK